MDARDLEQLEDTPAPYRHAEQPLPTGNGASVTAEVRRLLDERERKGIATYGTTLRTHNGRDVLRDLTEELLDAVQYAVQLRMERDDEAGTYGFAAPLSAADWQRNECDAAAMAAEIAKLRERLLETEHDLANTIAAAQGFQADARAASVEAQRLAKEHEADVKTMDSMASEAKVWEEAVKERTAKLEADRDEARRFWDIWKNTCAGLNGTLAAIRNALPPADDYRKDADLPGAVQALRQQAEEAGFQRDSARVSLAEVTAEFTAYRNEREPAYRRRAEEAEKALAKRKTEDEKRAALCHRSYACVGLDVSDPAAPKVVSVGTYSEPASMLTTMRGLVYACVVESPGCASYHEAAQEVRRMLEGHPDWRWMLKERRFEEPVKPPCPSPGHCLSCDGAASTPRTCADCASYKPGAADEPDSGVCRKRNRGISLIDAESCPLWTKGGGQ